jgi:hypothetical protein
MRARTYDRPLLLEHSSGAGRTLEGLGIVERFHAHPPRALDAEQPFELESGFLNLRFEFFREMEEGGREGGVLRARHVPTIDEGSL